MGQGKDLIGAAPMRTDRIYTRAACEMYPLSGEDFQIPIRKTSMQNRKSPVILDSTAIQR
ncbi:hypothetical protein SAMCFNEI73_Ch3528 [Sinorhizobium americanum]|uniref:Uncharacterized protein n=1 Tax=Sinorhizobium americanum TaxID=194963 RepID=A0A1L3LRQ8_9HYPH|nr:hypothetical protein SAMCCGM7_Ch3407 [Sinorhizobium americanum CCGM7]APG92780.1 hypothetical protein SAMCFNEI73_Ch3528 [Sinorhizobium americanum]